MRIEFKCLLGLKFYLLFLLAFGNSKAYSQEHFGVGASGIYNLQSTGIGAGIRVQFPLSDRLSLVPQVLYFPSFNIVHEGFGGINLHYNLVLREKWTAYLLGGGFMNYWINSSSSAYKKAKNLNLIPEAGGGLMFGKRSLKPFVEQRYNFTWQEGSFHFGLIWYPGCKGPSDGLICPAYF